MFFQNEKANLPPTTIDECMEDLSKILSSTEKDIFMKSSKEELITFHHGLGRWIRNTWKLWQDSELNKYMKSLGFIHPDDMSQAIIIEYWNRLNNQSSDLKQNAEEAKQYWDKLK